jgi:hypothetical protein
MAARSGIAKTSFGADCADDVSSEPLLDLRQGRTIDLR